MAKSRKPPIHEEMSSNPFAGLGRLRDELPVGEPMPTSEEAALPVKAKRGPARAVVRYQRKGRGGKEATIVEQLGLGPDEADAWCREFKRTLGCGGGVEGENLVFSGDQRDRLKGLLEGKGVRKVTVA